MDEFLQRTDFFIFTFSNIFFSTYTKYKTYDSKQLRWDLEIIKFIARNNLPFNIVNTQATKDLFKFADPKLTLKSATTFSRFKLPLLYENVKFAVDKILSEELPDSGGMAVSTDLWASRANDNYQSLTIHFINKSWKLQNFVLGASQIKGNLIQVFINV